MLQPSENNSYLPANGFNRNATLGIPGTVFSSPWDVAVTPNGTGLWVSDSGNNRVVRLDLANNVQRSIGDLSNPKGLSYDEIGCLMVADYGNSRVVSILNDSFYGGFSQKALKTSGDATVLCVTDGTDVKQFDSDRNSLIRQIPTSFGLKNPRSVSIWHAQTEQRV